MLSPTAGFLCDIHCHLNLTQEPLHPTMTEAASQRLTASLKGSPVLLVKNHK